MQISYRRSCSFERYLLTGEEQRSDTHLHWGICRLRGWSYILAADNVMKRWSSQDIICCIVLFNLVKKEKHIYFLGNHGLIEKSLYAVPLFCVFPVPFFCFWALVQLRINFISPYKVVIKSNEKKYIYFISNNLLN